MTNLEIADALDRLADLLQVERENPFKVRAFRRAARTVEGHPVPMEQLLAGGGDPSSLPGIGREIANVIRELVATGKSTRIETMAQSAPPSLLELTRLPGLGPKRARLVWDRLGIATLPELEAAAAAGRLADLPGFGDKTQTRILTALAEKREAGRRLLLSAAEVILVDLLRHLRAVPGVVRVEAAGSFRRRFETVGDLDVVCASTEPRRALAAFTGWHRTARVEGAGDTRATIVLRRGAQVDLRVVPPESFGAAWIYLTGSKAHNVRLRGLAVERGWKLSEWGLFAGRDGKSASNQGERIAGATEEEVYAALDLAWVPPELREDEGELAAAAAGTLPDLVHLDQLRGDLQMHTTWSDGRADLESMVAACAARGYAYCAITDHGPGLPVVQGLDASALRAQHREIAEVQARHPEIRVLHALELDVMEDGSFPLSEEGLAPLDLLLAAVHTRLKLPREAQTERYLRALDHPRVAILAHPTARRLGRRGRVDADWDAILAKAAARGVAVEANGSPERLDLDGGLLRRARAHGCRVVVSTDAHNVRELDNLRWGVDQARRGWLTTGDVVNTLPLPELLSWLRPKRARGA
ncbi:MAG TPA: DNA polymerase/3'-5' exonuclease PolX [Thermoanaerobaculia bacterium]|nr:DNA polymerase/3'-5' exonuclease PolX [Thermoanaerobaculia bacterium]